MRGCVAFNYPARRIREAQNNRDIDNNKKNKNREKIKTRNTPTVVPRCVIDLPREVGAIRRKPSEETEIGNNNVSVFDVLRGRPSTYENVQKT